MPSYQIKQSSTAYPLVFLMIDSTDHVSGKTGLTPTVTLSKAGASFGSPSGSVTEIANGWYKVAGNATDSGTLGPLLLHATAAGADPVDCLYEVVAIDPQVAAVTLPSIPSNWITSGGIAASALNGKGDWYTGTPPTSAVIAAAVWDLTTSSHTTGGTFGELATGVNVAKWSGAAVATPNVAGYPLVDLGKVNGSNVTTVSGTVDANVTQWSGANVATPDAAGFPKVTLKAGAGAGEIALTAGAVTVGTNSDKTGYSLAVAPPTSSVIAAAVWDLATTGHTAGGSFGAAMNAAGSAGDPWSTPLPGSYSTGTAGKIVGDRLDAAVSTRSTYSGGDTSGTTTLLARLTGQRATNLDNLDAAITTRSTYAGGAVASVTGPVGSVAAPVTVGTNNDKTNYSLASTGLDSIAATAPSGVASTFPEMIVQLWRRFFKKATKTTTQIKTYANDGVTVVTTQAITDDGAGNETQGAAS